MISDIAKITSIKKILIERQLFIFSGMLQGLTIDPRLLVEHSLFKNVSSGPAFCDKMQIVRLNMASLIIDTIRIKKKEVILILYTFWYEFTNDFDAQNDFGKFFVT